MHPSLKSARWLALAALLFLAAAALFHATRPTFGPAILLLPGQPPQPCAYPFRWKNAPRAPFILHLQLHLPARFPTTFNFYPQDFLSAIAVNGHGIRAPGLPLSAFSHEGRSIDLAPFLHPGLNQIQLQMAVRWGDARLRLAPSPWDKVSLLLLALVSAATCATAAFLCSLSKIKILQPEMALLLGGILLRYIYVAGTPYFIRSYDYWGHADYIDYLLRHLSLPPPGANWESFQPPLYYLFVAGLTKILLTFGLAEDQRYALWQGFSLLLGIGVLLLGRPIAHLLYENDSRRRLHLLALLAVAPPLVFNAARVTNDSLLTLLEFLWLALLLAWSRRPAPAAWAGLSLVTGLALLTKANALALLLVAALCLFIHQRLDLRTKLSSLALLLLLSSALAGWYYIPRALHASSLDVYMAGNIRGLTAPARIENVLRKSLVFNPAKIIRYPFDEPWGPRHDYFLEVFFKTIFIGEWIAGPFYKFLARLIMLNALLLLPLFLLGLYHAAAPARVRAWISCCRASSLAKIPLLCVLLRPIFRTGRPQFPSVPSAPPGEPSPATAPLLLTLATVFLAHWLFLQAAPFLSTQDFRYSVILLIPIACFVLNGIDHAPLPLPSTATFLLQLALLNSAIYLVTLSLGD